MLRSTRIPGILRSRFHPRQRARIQSQKHYSRADAEAIRTPTLLIGGADTQQDPQGFCQVVSEFFGRLTPSLDRPTGMR